jgi:hypothetical protein
MVLYVAHQISILQYNTDNPQATATLDCPQSILKSRSKARIRASGVRTHFPTIPTLHTNGPLVRSCQKQQTDEARCNFFLWDSDAHQREAAALSNNARTEVAPSELSTPARRKPSLPPPHVTKSAASEPSQKRNHVVIDLDDEYGIEEADDAFNTELESAMIAAETPSKAIKTSEFATPSTRRKLPWQMAPTTTANGTGLQTPQTGGRIHSVDPFNTRLSTPGSALFTSSKSNGLDDDTHQTTAPSSPFETPTPSRFRHVSAEDLSQDVFNILQDGNVRLSSETETALKALLTKYAKNAEGLKRGRDVQRTTVKAKDAKITELAYRVSTLEAELEAEKAMVKHLQWEAGVEDP